jgi:hypothetical protein
MALAKTNFTEVPPLRPVAAAAHAILLVSV